MTLRGLLTRLSLLAAAWLATPGAVAQHSDLLAPKGDLVLQDARVIVSPDEPALEHRTVVLHAGQIFAVKPVNAAGKMKASANAQVLDCRGMTIVAGFWNSHVHFTEPVWNGVANAPAPALEAHMQQMLTRWGFTTVWDLGSDPADTRALQRRIASGDVAGPRILMAGDIFPAGGHPVYLPKELHLPEAATPAEAAALAAGDLRAGDAGIKLFTGSYMGEDHPVINMDTAIAKAAVEVAHQQAKPVFTHPQNYAGVDNALAAGVDVLAHTIPTERAYKPEELARMKEQKTALIPTLALWRIVMTEAKAPPAVTEHVIQYGVDQLKSFFAQGGTVLFGTDVGFHQEYDTTHELEYMGRALGWKDILASLTTNPCDFFKREHCGHVVVGNHADLVVLEADPAADVRNLAKVAYTVRGGSVIYSAKQ